MKKADPLRPRTRAPTDGHGRGGEAGAAAARGPAVGLPTFDIDVADPACAPGTGAPVAGGLSSRQLLDLAEVSWRRCPCGPWTSSRSRRPSTPRHHPLPRSAARLRDLRRPRAQEGLSRPSGRASACRAASKTKRCWVGRNSCLFTSRKPAGSHSPSTCSTDIRCSGRMWAALSPSRRYSTRAIRPSALRPRASSQHRLRLLELVVDVDQQDPVERSRG